MATLAKEIAEAAVVTSGKSVKTTGANGLAQMEEKEVNKKTSINQIIESALALPTIENDVTFGGMYKNAPNDVAKNGLKAAWMQMPHVQCAFNISLFGIIEKCKNASNTGLFDSYLDEALRVVTTYAKKFSTDKVSYGVVIFKECNKDTKEFKPITVVTKNGTEVVSNMVCELVEADKVTLNKRISALASAYRLVNKSNKGVKSLSDLKFEASVALAKVQNLMSKEDFAEWLKDLIEC